MSKKGLGKFAVGAAIGAGLGLLFAPKKGEEIRKELKVKLDDLLKKVDEIDAEDVKNEFDTRLNVIKKELKDLDKEKALDIAKGDYIFLHNPKYKYSKTTIESLYKNAVLTNSDVFLFKINNEFDTGFDDLLTYDLENVFQDKTFGFFTFSYKDIREYIMGAVLSPWFKFYNKQFLYENDDLYLGLDNSLNFIALHISSLLMANNISFLPVSSNSFLVNVSVLSTLLLTWFW